MGGIALVCLRPVCLSIRLQRHLVKTRRNHDVFLRRVRLRVAIGMVRTFVVKFAQHSPGWGARIETIVVAVALRNGIRQRFQVVFQILWNHKQIVASDKEIIEFVQIVLPDKSRNAPYFLSYSSGPRWGMETAGSLGSDFVEKAKKPSQSGAQVSRIARICVWCDFFIV